MVVEGINAIPAAMALSEKNEIEMPIIAAVDAIINHRADPKDAVHELMGRDSKTELTKPVLDLNYEAAVIKSAAMRVKGGQSIKRVITFWTLTFYIMGISIFFVGQGRSEITCLWSFLQMSSTGMRSTRNVTSPMSREKLW